MSSTTFTDGTTVIYSSWLNDVNTATYTTVPAIIAGTQVVGNATNATNATTATNATNVTGTIASAATATTQTAGDNSTKVATTAFVTTAVSAVSAPSYASLAEVQAGTITNKVVNPSTLQNGKGVLGTVQNATSGTSLSFTGIPSWVKRITVSIANLQTSGTDWPVITIGPSGGVETSGYTGSLTVVNNVAFTAINFTTGVPTCYTSSSSADVQQASYVFTLVDPATNTWNYYGMVSNSNITRVQHVTGSKSLAGTLTQLRLAISTGSYSAGKVNILYE